MDSSRFGMSSVPVAVAQLSGTSQILQGKFDSVRMSKSSSKLLIVFLILCLLVLSPKAISAESISTDRKYFFPYGACIVYTIQKFKRIQSTLGTDYDILEVHIDRVLRGPFTNGQSMELSFDSSPEFFPKKDASEVIGQRCVLAFNPLGFAPGKDTSCSMEDPYAPFPYQTFTDADVAKLGKEIDSVKMAPAELKPAIQSFLEHRWTAKRLADYCRPELRNLSSGNHLKGEMAGQLPLESKDGCAAEWRALLSEGVITYEVTAHNDNSSWNVESRHPTLIPFSDDDFLAYRIRQTLESCFESYRLTRKFDDAIEPHSPFREGSFRVVRNSRNGITAVECKQLDEKTVTALLDSGLTVKSILVNGVADETWNMMLRDVNKNIDLMNSGGIRENWDDIKDPRARQLLFRIRLVILLCSLTIVSAIVGLAFAFSSLRKHRTTNQIKYSKRIWFIVAGLVPFVFVAAQQIVLNIMIRLPLPSSNLCAYVSLSWLCGIVPFLLAFVLIGLLQPVWRDPDLPVGTFVGFLKRSMPWILILFAMWCAVLGSYSFLNTMF